MDIGEAVEIRDDFALLRVEDDELICVHVGDVKATMSGVKALIVKTNGGSGEWNVGDLRQQS